MLIRQHKIFFFLILAFALPLVVSYILFFYRENFHFNTTNHGALLNPPIQVNTLLKNPLKQWQIIFSPNPCNDEQAEKTMFILHQLRTALGENQKRVGLTLWVDQTCPSSQTHDFRKVTLTHDQIMQLQNTFNHVVMNNIYLIDPLGNLFMYYPSTTDPMGIFKDVKKVLGASQIG